jgi:hypothetical protein
MRRIILLFALMSASSPVHADPILPGDLFIPGSIFVDIAKPIFGNRTNTLCWRCGDASSLNDLRLLIGGGENDLHFRYPESFAAGSIGSLSVSGPAPNFDGLNVSFTFRVTTTVTTQIHGDDRNHPEDLPQPSVSKGIVMGNVFGVGGRQLILTYGGRVGAVTFVESSDPLTNPFTVPLGGGSKSFTSEIFVSRDEISYAPAPSVVPEPLSMILLGTGLAAAALKARRARNPL